ncbi:MAG: CHAD domain-containing protein [Candidatus Kapabacteria bacterium]|nr:CHAD domain-containing protein [Candidatus Kapabacteria bacterium]
MKTEILNGYINKRLNSVIRHIKSYEKNENSKHLHQIRVNIKKIKAMLSFAGYVFDKKYQINKIRKLFQKAGEIRELQLNIKLLEGLGNPPDKIILQLRIKEKFLNEIFTSNISNYLKNIKKIRNEISLPTMTAKKGLLKNLLEKR